MSKVIGIDLGTTNSCVAVMEGKRGVVINNKEGDMLTPSMVAVTEKSELLVGTLAKRQAVANPKNTIFSVKRLIGRKFDSDELKDLRNTVPYSIVRAPNGDAWVRLGEKERSPPDISAHVLTSLRKVAEAHVGEKVSDAVITVPAQFNDAQRQATKDAGKIAGLNVLRIINEPTAAALAYGVQKGTDQTIAVFDLGGGTFDISILEVAGGAFEVLSTAGDNLLGGDDFDVRLVEHLVDEVDRQSGANISRDATALRRLKEVAETAKKELSNREATSINVPFLTEHRNKPVHLKIDSLGRSLLESLVTEELDRLRGPCEQALEDAGLDVKDIDKVLLVGGQTRMPAVQRVVQEIFKKKPSKDVNPDQIVSIGAAVQGSVLSGDRTDAVLMDVTPHSLGIRVVDGKFSRVIDRNTRVPCRQVKNFAPAERGQDFVTLEVFQGEADEVKENTHLAEFTLADLPVFEGRDTHIQVTFMIDADGLANVSAIEPTTNKEASVKIEPSGGLSKDQVDDLAKDRKD